MWAGKYRDTCITMKYVHAMYHPLAGRRGVQQVLEAMAAIAVGTVRKIVEEVMGRDLHRAH